MPVRGTTSERYYHIGEIMMDYFSLVYPNVQVVLNQKEISSASDAEVDGFLCEALYG